MKGCNIQLNNGGVARVDARDRARLVSMGRWSLVNGYAAQSMKLNGAWAMVLMHRLIVGAGDGRVVDHLNGDRLDNRRANLRVCSRSQNQMNRRKLAGRFRFKGVWRGDRGRWRAQIRVDGRLLYLGRFDTDSDAAHAYDAAARQHFGQFAHLNFPEVPR